MDVGRRRLMERPTEHVTERATESATKRATIRATERATEPATKRATVRATERAAELATRQATERTAARAIDRSPDRSTSVRGSLYMVGTAVMFASAFVATKYTVDTVPPLLAAALRFTVAALVLSMFTLVRSGQGQNHDDGARGATNVASAERWRIAFLGLLGVFAYHGLFFWALQFTSASLAALIVPTTLPLATAFIARGMLREPLGPYSVPGVVAASVGVVMAVGQAADTGSTAQGDFGQDLGGSSADLGGIGPDSGGSSADLGGIGSAVGGFGSTLDALLGPAALLVAVVCFAMYSVIGYGPVARYGALRTTTYVTIVGAVLLMVSAASEWTALPVVSPGAWAAIVFMGAGSSALGLVWHYRGGALLGPGRAAGFLYLVPLFAVTGSVTLLGETVGVWQLVGGLFIVIGVVLVQRRTGRSVGAVSRP